MGPSRKPLGRGCANMAIEEVKPHAPEELSCNNCPATLASPELRLTQHECSSSSTNPEVATMSTAKEYPKVAKQWHRCLICAKAYEREESLHEHMTRHKNQMKKRQQRLQESQGVEHAVKAPRTLSAPSIRAPPRVKFIP
ncbi:Aste57867_18630 [Aphanomyces stellatus]|uniref:Aste57867_18630 protein n=1 Tax=Aphanomyces stellatus TaxID=120398 RepID=A0A485LAV3_9STRA|nr:hypothetical protein As57867_018568 [Aphanomyces stellatus]VFT95365.1 Aste57867_18630 [Aphanomyces stellatus]